MKKVISIIIICFFISTSVFTEEKTYGDLPKQEWSFKGITGTFDRASLQRGYKVYREVCSGCHSMNLLYYRDLADIGFTDEEIKAIASEYTVIDGPNEEGEMYERSAKPSDKFVDPYLNDQEARISNNGAYPPDLSVITKAKKGGSDYIYNLLVGYDDPPSGVELGEGMYYNKWMSGNQIAMPIPLYDGSVDYDDGTDNNYKQLSKDVTAFLVWAAEPELEERKSMGIKVILFFIVFGFLAYLSKKRLWKDIS